MKIIFASMLTLFFLTSATVFAQDNNSNAVEAYLGFQYNIDIQDNETTLIPSLSFGARGYFMEVTPGIQLGWASFASVGFISEMAWAGQRITTDDPGYTMVGGIPVANGFQADRMFNVGLFVGVSLRGDIAEAGAGALGFVADLGIVGNADMATFETVRRFDVYQPPPVAGVYPPPTFWAREVWTYDLMDFNLGVGLNAALQYRIPIMDTRSVIFEVGANFSICFISQISLTATETEYDRNGNEIRRASLTLSAPAEREGLRTRIAPYLLIGFRF